MNWLSNYFTLDERGSSITTEVRAGATIFMAMAYIIFANPAILAAGGVPLEGAIVATCLVAGIMSILMGIITNYPICMAAGMGINALLAFGLVKGMGITWQTAMGVVVLEGLVVLLLSASTLRSRVMDAIPASLKHAIAAGIGLFITFIGLQNGHIISAHPATMIAFQDLTNPVTVLSILGFIISAALLALRVKGALLFGILITALLGMVPMWSSPIENSTGAGRVALLALPAEVLQWPSDFSTLFQFDLKQALQWKLIPVAFALLMTDFFDTLGSALAVTTKAGLLDDQGRIPRLKRLLIVDSVGAVAGGMAGCSSNTTYIESAAGVTEGGRTGLSAVTCGVLFLLAMFFVPLVSVIGGGVEIAPGVFKNPVTAGSLILVGFFMIDTIRHIQWDSIEESLPAFMVIAMTPFTFSITHGIGAGVITYVFIMAIRGKVGSISPLLWITAFLFAMVFLTPVLSGYIT